MKKSSPSSVGEILAGLMKKTGLGKQMDQARIWDQWEDLAGPHLAPHGRPHAVRDNTLLVEVDGAVWMNKYAYHKWDILKRINALFKRELISDIFIMLTPDDAPTLPQPAPGKEGAGAPPE